MGGRLLLIILLFTIISNCPLSAETAEQKMYRNLKNIPSSENSTFEKESAAFLKKYPRSTLVPDVRFMQAERERDIDLALETYTGIVKNFPSYERRDVALYRSCQIYELKSKWKELERESGRGIRMFTRGRYLVEFRFMRATSLMMQERYDECRDECMRITEESHDFETLSRAIYFIAETDKLTTGNSKAYISGIKELVIGYKGSLLYPSILYRLGLFYDEKRESDKAYSAYSDLIKKFPESPEADLAINRLEKLKKDKPRYVNYLPDQRTVDESDSIDIQPEYEVKREDSPVYYSVSIGPFTKRRDAEKIIRLLNSYDDSRVEKTASGYIVFNGRYSDRDEALGARIRLAEEFGINGEIVRFSEKKSKSYIYGD